MNDRALMVRLLYSDPQKNIKNLAPPKIEQSSRLFCDTETFSCGFWIIQVPMALYSNLHSLNMHSKKLIIISVRTVSGLGSMQGPA